MNDTKQASAALPRSAGTRTTRRPQLPWPAARDFRILSIDGGGIRGIFPAAVLAGLEEAHLGGKPIGAYFDLITGTSTGGIIALGLAAGLPASRILKLYLERGCKVFPRPASPLAAWVTNKARSVWSLSAYRYCRAPLEDMLSDTLGIMQLHDAKTRLCIPAFEGHYGEVYIFKTPHHPDYKRDFREPMVQVALATGAAPTFFRALARGGYTFVDGGLWANNPVMIGLVDALACYDVPRERVRILSIGNGPYRTPMSWSQCVRGGAISWRTGLFAAMDLQSQNAIGQAGLLIGRDRLLRLDVPSLARVIEMDNWQAASRLLPPAAAQVLTESGEKIREAFLTDTVEPWTPFYRR